jgi:hypothetical protein
MNWQKFIDNIASDPYKAHMAAFQKYPPKKPIDQPMRIMARLFRSGHAPWEIMSIAQK